MGAVIAQVEARTGVFSNVGRSLTLTVKTIEKGTVTIDPDLLANHMDVENPADPNWADPNDPNEPRIYTDGTEVVLVAEPTPFYSKNLAAKSVQTAAYRSSQLPS